jgi:hypothetical protein
MKEETGFTARLEDITKVSPIIFCDPWKSNENDVIVSLRLDMTLPENLNP